MRRNDAQLPSRQSLYYRIKPGMASLDSTKHGGETKLAQARKGRIMVNAIVVLYKLGYGVNIENYGLGRSSGSSTAPGGYRRHGQLY